jgi:uncharacterized membrane protein YfcA
MTTLLVLLLVSFVVGVCIGAVGIGGILLIPALAASGMGMHEAMATALFTFLFTGISGTALFERRGSIRWGMALPVCAGALVFGFAGAWANARLDARWLTAVLAGVILVAGLHTLRSHFARAPQALRENAHGRRALLLAIGATVGFGSGLTGVGGPAISVPIMVMCGFAPLATIGVGQVVQVMAAVSGSVANARYGTIDYGLAVPLVVAQLVGVPLGVRLVHAVDARVLRLAMAWLCIAVGGWLAVRACAT